MENSDYEKALESVKNMPHVYLGQEVKTDIGKGIIVKIEMDNNGLYLTPRYARCVVWFSSHNTNGWVNKTFLLSELKINYRKEKLTKINELWNI